MILKIILPILFFLSCSTHLNKVYNLIEVRPDEMILDHQGSKFRCTGEGSKESREILFHEEKINLQCKNGYLGGIWLKRDPSIILAQSSGDAGTTWNYRSVLFQDLSGELVVMKSSEAVYDRSFDCGTLPPRMFFKDSPVVSCDKIPDRYRCSKSVKFYKLTKGAMKEMHFNGPTPKVKSTSFKLFKDKCINK